MKIKQFLFITVIWLVAFSSVYAQRFTMESITGYPFPSELTAASNSSKIALAVNEKGKRNVYVAEGPAFNLKKITSYNQDDGQELTGISISPDGKRVVYVRGGDHGAFDESVPRNPASYPYTAKIEILSIPYTGGDPVVLDEGDQPQISPDSRMVAYIKGGQVWIVSIDRSSNPKRLFHARGSSGDIKWSPDGSRLLFVSSRGRHSFIGIFKDSLTPIQWISPEFARDLSPVWSLDGKKIVFVRRPARGGAPDSLTVKPIEPWSILTADVNTGKSSVIWKSPQTLKGSVPSIHGRYNLHWAANDRIVFMSYEDGWPHMYSIAAGGGKAIQLTKGNFMCEHVTISPDGNWLLASANTGPLKDDADRRHIIRVPTGKPQMEVLTPGKGIEAFPKITGDGAFIVYFSSTAQRPPLLATMAIDRKEIRLRGETLIPNDFPVADMVTPESVQFKASDGVTVFGQIFKPKSGPAKKPAMLFIHGGPQRQMLNGWHYGDYYSNTYAINQYLVSLGFIVLSVNYRLGIGYGYDFHHPKKSGMYGVSEYLDIKAAGEWMARQADIDANRIGVYGGSYGGYLTALALGKNSELFAAGVDIHGVHNNLSELPASTAEQPPDYELAKKLAWESSPVAWIDKWTSPVLFIHGDDDGNVPFDESIDLIRRFEQKKKTYESLVIPDETHHWMKYSNIVRVNEAITEFLYRKLINK